METFHWRDFHLKANNLKLQTECKCSWKMREAYVENLMVPVTRLCALILQLQTRMPGQWRKGISVLLWKLIYKRFRRTSLSHLHLLSFAFCVFLFFSLNMRALHMLTFNIKTEVVSDWLFIKNDSCGLDNEFTS